MKQTILRLAVFVTGTFLFASCGNSADQSKQAAPPPVMVTVDTVTAGSSMYYDIYPATVTAVNQVEVRPQVSGYITGVFFREGEFVNKGKKLYQVDNQQYLGAYDQAVANLKASKANAAKAKQDAERYEELEQHDAIARQTVEHAQADLETANKQVDASKANVEAVATNLRYSTIYAPFSGTIGISEVKMGTSVSAGQTLLNTISSDDPIAVDFAADEKEIPTLVRLQEKKAVSRDSTFTLMLADQSVYPYPGYISIIDRAVDPQTGTIKTRLVFSNTKKILKAGMSCNVRLKNNTSTQSILIPYRSVTEQMGEYFVFIVGDSNKVSQHKVILGTRILGNVVVKSGLELNQKIVTDGVQKLKEGSIVTYGARPAMPDSSKSTTGDSTKGK